jgi:hypothetical protein
VLQAEYSDDRKMRMFRLLAWEGKANTVAALSDRRLAIANQSHVMAAIAIEDAVREGKYLNDIFDFMRKGTLNTWSWKEISEIPQDPEELENFMRARAVFLLAGCIMSTPEFSSHPLDLGLSWDNITHIKLGGTVKSYTDQQLTKIREEGPPRKTKEDLLNKIYSDFLTVHENAFTRAITTVILEYANVDSLINYTVIIPNMHRCFAEVFGQGDFDKLQLGQQGKG